MEIGYYVTAETLENEISYAVCAANLTDYREHSIGMIELAMDRTAYLNSITSTKKFILVIDASLTNATQALKAAQLVYDMTKQVGFERWTV